MADYSKLTLQELIAGISQTEAAVRRLREFLELTTRTPPIGAGLRNLVEAASLHIDQLEADLDELKSTLEAKAS